MLDNTGSMTQTDSTGTSKLSALQTASHNLITTLQGASTTVGDVQMSLTTFAKLVNVGTGNVNATWIDWTDWSAEPFDYNGTYDPPVTPTAGILLGYVGPGDPCPYNTSNDGFVCVTQPAGSSTASTVPSSGTYKGYICPSVMQIYNDVETFKSTSITGGHYFNGCYTSTANGTTKTVSGPSSSATCTGSGYANCSCTGSGSSKVCKAPQYTYTWIVNAKSTWGGCIEDRTQSYDTQNTAPSGTATNFPAANDQNCPITTVTPATRDLDHGAMDHAEHRDQQYDGAGLDQSDHRPGAWLAKHHQRPALWRAGFARQYQSIYYPGERRPQYRGSLVWQRLRPVRFRGRARKPGLHQRQGRRYHHLHHLCGSERNPGATPRRCKAAPPIPHKYFDLTSSGAIITTLNDIAQQITDLRVSK